MGKRFTATERWDKEWYRNLSCRQKCFWEYILAKCDVAGVWEADFGLASFQIGEPVSVKDIAGFGDRIEKLPSGKYWVKDFISFQYGHLSQGCKPHAPVYRLIERHKLENRLWKANGSLSEGYPMGNGNPEEEEEDKEQGKEREQGRDSL